MTRPFYSLLYYLAMPGVWLRALWRSIKEPEYRQTPLQRFGVVPESSGEAPVIWVHAISAGETIAAAPLVKRLLGHGCRVVMTNMTPTGRERARTLLGNEVENYYAPYDLPGSVKRFLNRVNPCVLVIIDTELWPNMIHFSVKAGVKVVLANARMSEKSARGYGRIKKIAAGMMRDVSVVATQTLQHGERFVALGLDRSKLHTVGSIKFDNRLPKDFQERVEDIKNDLGPNSKFIAASTHAGEEAAVLAAFSVLVRKFPDLQLILAPRHPHRASEVAKLVRNAGFSLSRRSESGSHRTSVFMLDTIGELNYFYGASDVAFIGGSMVPVGGHNFLEAVVAQLPVVMGRFIHDIEDIAAQFVNDNAMTIVADEAGLEQALAKILTDDLYRRSIVNNANAIYKRNEGALQRVESLVMALVGQM